MKSIIWPPGTGLATSEIYWISLHEQSWIHRHNLEDQIEGKSEDRKNLKKDYHRTKKVKKCKTEKINSTVLKRLVKMTESKRLNVTFFYFKNDRILQL